MKTSRLDKINPITGLSLRQMRLMTDKELAKYNVIRIKKIIETAK